MVKEGDAAAAGKKCLAFLDRNGTRYYSNLAPSSEIGRSERSRREIDRSGKWRRWGDISSRRDARGGMPQKTTQIFRLTNGTLCITFPRYMRKYACYLRVASCHV